MILKSLKLIFISYLLIACEPSKKSNDLDQLCDNIAEFGSIDICLPELEGLMECYKDSFYHETFKSVKLESNIILAYYIPDSIFELKQNLLELSFDDYIKIYSIKRLIPVSADEPELNKLSNMMNNQFIKENWDDIKAPVDEKLAKIFANPVTFGQSVLIESYAPHQLVNTSVVITKIDDSFKELYRLNTVNIAVIKNRILFVAYYLYYDGPKSIEKLKSKNDYFIYKLLSVNE